MTHRFWLVDLALVDNIPPGIIAHLASPDSGMVPLYEEEEEWVVSPILIECTLKERVAAIFDACHPMHHVSLVETPLQIQALAEHLREQLFIETDMQDTYAISLADCRVLPALHKHFSAAQWASLTHVMTRWQVHDRQGQLYDLPMAKADVEPTTAPLLLTSYQLDGILLEAEPDQILWYLKDHIPAHTSHARQYEWACMALSLWQHSAHTDRSVLVALATAIFKTQGDILNNKHLPEMLKEQDTYALRIKLHALAGH